MDSGYYAAMTGLVARTQALDTAAANLANAQTPGYRAEREYFRSVLLGPDAGDSQLGRTVNNYGLLGGDQPEHGAGRARGNRQSSRSGDRRPGIFCGADAERRPLHARRQFSSGAERTVGDPGRRGGAFGDGSAYPDSAGRGRGGGRRRNFGGGWRRSRKWAFSPFPPGPI